MVNVGIRADSLSAEDFEHFANDLCRLVFSNQDIHGYPEGRDKGIDGIDHISHPKIVIQAKKWSLHKRSALSEVNDEIQKIQHTAKEWHWDKFKYVFVTSMGLSPDVQHTLLKDNPSLFPSDEYLIDLKRIDEYSSDPRYRAVYEKYGLINASLFTILKEDRLESMDSDYIENFDPKYFAETSFLIDAYKILKRKQIVLIHGNPGVGKTSLCKMLGHLFANSQVGEDGKVSVLWRTIDAAAKVVEQFNSTFKGTDNTLLVVFDDFLGSNLLESGSRDIQKLQTLLSKLTVNPNLYIILNSRTHILETAKQQISNLSSLLDGQYRNALEMIDMSKYTDLEKAKLLRVTLEKEFASREEKERSEFADNYNQLRNRIAKTQFRGLPSQQPKQYTQVIQHRNYNPRIIEYIAHHFTDKKDVLSFILSNLDKPKQVYDAPFEQLNVDEKRVLFCLYSFKRNSVPKNLLLESFDDFKSPEFDVENCLSRFNNSWLRTDVPTLEEQQIGFANPGIVDFLTEKNQSIRFTNYIKRKSHALQQIQKITPEKEFLTILLNRWSSFRDKNHFVGEYTVAVVYQSKDDNKTLKVLKDALNSYDGTWNLGSSNGWYCIFSAILQTNPSLLSSVIDELSKQDIADNIFSSTMSMDEFDSIVDILEPVISQRYGISLESQQYSDLNYGSPGFDLIKTLVNKKKGLIQDALDSPESYDGDIREALDCGKSKSEIEDMVSEQILDYDFGNQLNIYDTIDFDITSISDYIDEVRNAPFEKEWDEYDDSVPDLEAGIPQETVDDILDRPLDE